MDALLPEPNYTRSLSKLLPFSNRKRAVAIKQQPDKYCSINQMKQYQYIIL